MNFLESPIQTEQLQAQGIQAPASILDATAAAAANEVPALKRARHVQSTDYLKAVEGKVAVGLAAYDDVVTAQRYDFGTYLIDLLPSTQRALNAINVADIVLALQPQFDAIQAQFNALQAQFNAQQLQTITIRNQLVRIEAQQQQAQVRHSNGFSTRDTDRIQPLLALPVLIQGQPMAPVLALPNNFPLTRGGLFRMTAQRTTVFLNYYAVEHAPDLTLKRKLDLLANYLGLPPKR